MKLGYQIKIENDLQRNIRLGFLMKRLKKLNKHNLHRFYIYRYRYHIYYI